MASSQVLFLIICSAEQHVNHSSMELFPVSVFLSTQITFLCLTEVSSGYRVWTVRPYICVVFVNCENNSFWRIRGGIKSAYCNGKTITQKAQQALQSLVNRDRGQLGKRSAFIQKMSFAFKLDEKPCEQRGSV